MQNSTQFTDEQLVVYLADGQVWAFEEIYERYIKQCFGLALRMLCDLDLTEEVIQEAFLKLWSKPHQYSAEKGRFASWILNVVHHRCVDELRRRRRSAASFSTSTFQDQIENKPDSCSELADQIWVLEQQQIVRQILSELPPPQRQVLELAYFRGLSQSEIARELDEPLGTVKSRTRAALHRLRSLIQTDDPAPKPALSGDTL